MDERIAGQLTLLSFYRRYVIAETLTILCSKSPKTGVPEGKSAQKPRFCARNALKWGFRRVKAHKNLDFVLKTPENKGSGGQKRTKMPILCSNTMLLTAGFFASKTIGLDFYPMQAMNNYGMRDEQEKCFALQKGPLGHDRLRTWSEGGTRGRPTKPKVEIQEF